MQKVIIVALLALQVALIAGQSQECMNYIANNEGCRSTEYTDTMGNPTICVGHLDSSQQYAGQTLSTDQCMQLFQSDIQTAVNGASGLVSNFGSLSDAQQCVLIDMTYNMGLGNIQQFTEFLGYVSNSNFSAAANDLSGTAWCGQVPNRCASDENMMSSGNYAQDYSFPPCYPSSSAFLNK